MLQPIDARVIVSKATKKGYIKRYEKYNYI
jgi:predicted transcriptional regulator of viral defense system